MRICFFAGAPYWGGLNNNGGTRTIIKSRETLEKLGHKVCIFSLTDTFMFFKHKPPVNKIPKKWDFYIAASILDLHEMLKHVPPKKSAVWIRGVETWRKPFDKLKKIVDKASNQGVRIFVNAKHLQTKYGGEILYPGYDSIWSGNPRTLSNKKLTIGVLRHIKKSKGYGFFEKVKYKLGGIYNYVETGKNITDDFGMAAKYNKCDIWFAPTRLEGLHCPPMEAALCGCLVVCSNHPENGMVPDYANRETAMVYNYGNVESAISCIRKADSSKIPMMIEKIKTDIGTREINMKKLIKLIGG